MKRKRYSDEQIAFALRQTQNSKQRLKAILPSVGCYPASSLTLMPFAPPRKPPPICVPNSMPGQSPAWIMR